MPSRRGFLAATTSVGAVVTAGCLGSGDVAGLSATHHIEVPPGVEPSFAKRYLSPAELAVYVERQRERFGDAAPWSLRHQVRHEGDFVGAWQSTRSVEARNAQVATVETVCLTRRIEEGETTRLRHVLWAGSSLTRDRQPLIGGTGPSIALDTMSVGIDTGDGPIELRAVAPRDPTAAIENGTLIVGTEGMPALRRPTPGGELNVRYSPGERNRYAFEWRGTRTEPLALLAVCETTVPPAEEPLRFALTASVGVDTPGVV